MMLRLIFLPTLIWFSSSQRYFFPSDDRADIETATNNCLTRYTGGGRLYPYTPFAFVRMRRVFRDYEFTPCEEGEDCSEYYITKTDNSTCRILRTEPFPRYREDLVKPSDCTTPRRYICISKHHQCEQPLAINNCLEGCVQYSSFAYHCTKCVEGFTHSDRCLDNNECLLGTHDCHELADCINIPGSFECKCKTGIGGDGRSCQDYDECSSGTHQCQGNLNCINTLGSYQCSCETGFEYDGINCKDIDECSTGAHQCSENAECINSVSSYRCSCLADYEGDGKVCRVSTNLGRNATTAAGAVASKSNFIVPVLAVLFALSIFALFGMFFKQKREKFIKGENKEILTENYEKINSRSAYQN